MEFEENFIESINENTLQGIIKLFGNLCGEEIIIEDKDKPLLERIIKNAIKQSIDYEQFNEILLLLNEKRVSKCFFDFFFNPENGKISCKNIKRGVIKFRGYAMLCFGNFRFAYKKLIEQEGEKFKESLSPYCNESQEIVRKFHERAKKALDIDKIEENKIWYTGYLPLQLYYNDYMQAAALRFKNNDITLQDSEIINELKKINKEPIDVKRISEYIKEKELQKFLPRLTKIENELNKTKKYIEETIETARQNTDIYLTWDYMDVYIATSMREKWEFEFTFNFIQKIFNNKKIKSLNLRYFDPTQSFLENRIDKGLIEGLMLKRAKCTIYLSQETDTLGKDSELAATLAQGKPVIAYVPIMRNTNISKYINKIKKRPLDFFWKRILLLHLEEILNDPECSYEIQTNFPDKNFLKCEIEFFNKIVELQSQKKFNLISLEDEEFKEQHKEIIEDICKIIAIAEKHYFEKRAKLLKEIHPLAIQVDLKSGVANGVLVVRTIKECTDLLYNILTNSLKFNIKHKAGVTILEEEISKCPYRVVTDNPRITNSFWNFYL